MTQHHYNYIAVLAKTILRVGKITFTDNRQRSGTITLPALDAECITGYIFAPNTNEAKERAVDELKKLYPQEKGYGNHENMLIQQAQEVTV